MNSFTSLDNDTGPYGGNLDVDTPEMQEYKKSEIAAAQARSVEKAQKKQHRQEFPLPRSDVPKSRAAKALFMQVEAEGCVMLSEEPMGKKISASKPLDQEGCDEVTEAEAEASRSSRSGKKKRNLSRQNRREYVRSDSFKWTKCDEHDRKGCATCFFLASDTDENDSDVSCTSSGPSSSKSAKREDEQLAEPKPDERSKREPKDKAKAATEMRQTVSKLPDGLAGKEVELLRGLDPQQGLAVGAAAHGTNIAVVGPPGFGKSHVVGRAAAAVLLLSEAKLPEQDGGMVGVGPTHTSRRVQQQQVSRQGLDMPVHTLAAGYGVRVGESYAAASIVQRVQATRQAGGGKTVRVRQKAMDTFNAKAVWVDETGQVDPTNMDGIGGAAQMLRDDARSMGGQQQLWSLDLSQNLPVRPGTNNGDVSVRRLIFESEVFLQGQFWLVVLNTPYRNQDARMLQVFDHLACDKVSPQVVQFFEAASRVKFADDPLGMLPLKDRVRHLVMSNKMRDSIGKTNYLKSGPAWDCFEYVPHENLSKEQRAIFEKDYLSRYTIGPLILRKGEMYFFTGGTEEEVQVGTATLTSGEQLVLQDWSIQASGRVLLNVEALEQGSVEVTLDPVVLKTRGYIGGSWQQISVTVLPVIYGRVMTTYKSQGREFENVWVHAAGFRGDDNQMLTAVSRCTGNPWSGSLKVDGIQLKPVGQDQPDLAKKMRPYLKSLLMAKLLGKDVEAQKYENARRIVLAADPNWVRVEEAVEGRLL